MRDDEEIPLAIQAMLTLRKSASATFDQVFCHCALSADHAVGVVTLDNGVQSLQLARSELRVPLS